MQPFVYAFLLSAASQPVAHDPMVKDSLPSLAMISSGQTQPTVAKLANAEPMLPPIAMKLLPCDLETVFTYLNALKTPLVFHESAMPL